MQFYLVYIHVLYIVLKYFSLFFLRQVFFFFFFWWEVGERVRRFLNAEFTVKILRDFTWLKTGSSLWQFNAFYIMMALHASQFLKKELTLGLKVASFTMYFLIISFAHIRSPRVLICGEEIILPLGKDACSCVLSKISSLKKCPVLKVFCPDSEWLRRLAPRWHSDYGSL